MTSARQHDNLLEEAADWMALLHSGEATDDDHRRLQQWCQRSDAHQQTWQRAELLLGSLGQLPADIARPTLQRLHTQDRRKTLKALSLLALGVPLAALTASQLPWGVWQADLRTATGEQSRLTLADGSTLVLNTATAINLAFSARQRRLELKEGELLLSAAPDPLTPERPLVISTREGLIETRNARLSVQQRLRALCGGEVPPPLGVVQEESVVLVALVCSSVGVRRAVDDEIPGAVEEETGPAAVHRAPRPSGFAASTCPWCARHCE